MHYNNIICISAAIYWHIHVAIANYIIMGIVMSLIGMNTLRSRAVGASLRLAGLTTFLVDLLVKVVGTCNNCEYFSFKNNSNSRYTILTEHACRIIQYTKYTYVIDWRTAPHTHYKRYLHERTRTKSPASLTFELTTTHAYKTNNTKYYNSYTQ